MNTTLKETQVDSLKTELILERKRLQGSEVDTVHSGNDRLDIKAESPSNSDESAGPVAIETGIALEDHILRSIAQIDLALSRIEDGHYGVCSDCSSEIPLARLKAFPAAARCVSCKATFEDNRK